MKQLDPKAVWLFFIRFSLGWLVFVAFFGVYLAGATFLLFTVLFKISESDYTAFFIFLAWALVPLVFWYFWARLTYFYYRYDLITEGFKKELGVISKKYVSIPYDRIQNVDIHRGILARLLGLSDLNIQTAGSSYGGRIKNAEGRLPGLSKEIAEQLRDELISKARQTKSGL